MRKLYRSSRDRKLFGVCGGLAEYLGFDATLLRILLIVVTVFSAGSVFFVYILAGFVIPKEPGYGPAGYSNGWNGSQQQPSYGAQGWHPGSEWPGAAGTTSPPPRPAPAPTVARNETAPTASRPAQGLDAMMEDIEKKAMKREIEELKARLNKFEKDSKGE